MDYELNKCYFAKKKKIDQKYVIGIYAAGIVFYLLSFTGNVVFGSIGLAGVLGWIICYHYLYDHKCKLRQVFHLGDLDEKVKMVFLIAIACVVLQIIDVFSSGYAALGMICSIAVTGLMQWTIEDKVSDSKYMESVEKELINIDEKAMKACMLEKEDIADQFTPFEIRGFIFEGDNTLIKKGDDGNFRSNKYEVVRIYFTLHVLYCYKYTYNTTVQESAEKVDRYFYADIVQMGNMIKKVVLNVSDKEVPISIQTFEIINKGGVRFTMLLNPFEDTHESIKALIANIEEMKKRASEKPDALLNGIL